MGVSTPNEMLEPSISSLVSCSLTPKALVISRFLKLSAGKELSSEARFNEFSPDLAKMLATIRLPKPTCGFPETTQLHANHRNTHSSRMAQKVNSGSLTLADIYKGSFAFR
jgi:hypothetical protein